MKIAVYSIAKNEEGFVKRWYNSAKDADYLLIADTGSTDKTVQNALSLGIDVFDIGISPWRFDDARNKSLDLLPDDIDWCIALDMDEVLLPGWRQAIESAPDDATRIRYQYTWSWKEGGTPGLQYGGDKVHKRHGYRWKHPVHEVLVSEGVEKQAWVNMEIHHFPDSTKPRSQYLPLLKMAVEEDPDDDRNAFYYARELYFYSRLEEAASEFKRHLALPRATWKPERAASMRYLAKCEPQSAKNWLELAVMECPERREPWVELAMYYYQQEEWSACFYSALGAIKIKEKPLEYLCEESAWGSLPYDLAAISCYQMEMYDDAVRYGRTAYELSPSDQRIKDNLFYYFLKSSN